MDAPSPQPPPTATGALDRAVRFLEDTGAIHSAGFERLWALGRLAAVLIVALAAPLVLRDHPSFPLVLGALGGVLLYSLLLTLLAARGRLQLAFRVGFLLDNLTILGVWWTAAVLDAGIDAGGFDNDFYLLIVPVVIVGLVRLGWVVGLLYGVLWMLWIGVATIAFAGTDSHAFQQLPLRLMALALTVALAADLIRRLHQERALAVYEHTLAEEARHRAEQRATEVEALNRLYRTQLNDPAEAARVHRETLRTIHALAAAIQTTIDREAADDAAPLRDSPAGDAAIPPGNP